MSKPPESRNGATWVSRRVLLSNTVSASTVALVPLAVTSCSSTTSSPATAIPSVFSDGELVTLTAMVDRLMPADESSPAASECGVLDYMQRSLVGWNQGDVPLFKATLATLDDQARAVHGAAFATLDSDTQDALLVAMEAGSFPEGAGQAGFARILRLTLEGMFSDPWYGGNRNYAGWDLIGYPGAVLGSTRDMQAMGARLPLLHTSAYGAEHDGH